MNKFLKDCLKFASWIFIISFLLEVSLRSLPNDYKVKKNYLDLNSNKIQTLILGTSHTYYGINPDYINSNAFNAAYVSQTLNIDNEILLLYKNRLTSLKTVILPISYASIFSRLELEKEQWRIKNYQIYYGINVLNGIKYNSEVLGNKLYLNLVRIYHFLFNKKELLTCSMLGWGQNYQSNKSQDLKLSAVFAAKRHTQSNFNYCKLNTNDFKKIDKICKENHIRLIVITCPTHLAYRELLNQGQLSKMYSVLDSLHMECNFTYIDFSKDNRFIDEDFYDADHLNEKGAKKLSLMLNEYID